ncbi:MAG: sigma-54-dependent Fis family transcriptional regulator [Phycisphaerales bacterium]|nr:sigma-54-dependent Fis family transcriptional regulator [Phycisphaerales bacterium]
MADLPPELRAQVLIVEDESEHADVMADALRKPGHVCTIANDVAGALEELRGGAFDVIVTDLRMPNSAGVMTGVSGAKVAPDGGDAGMCILQAAQQLQPDAETVMVTAHGDVPTARTAFKHGVFDFIEKPLDLALFRSLINRAAEAVLTRHYAAKEAPGTEELVQHDGFEGIIAGSEPMRKILSTVKTVAPSNLPVLITGESGTGKELIAKALHANSNRAQQKFVPFNCAGQSESLLESELFGHVKGAFTGADKDRKGVFEYADKGTLFLDELGDMPLPMQAKLLRVLENGEIVPVGSNAPRKVDVRFVSATNKNLEQASKDKQFREDLYFRIKGAHIHLPPLRDRREDIPRIVRHAAAKYASELNRPAPDITDAALLRLTAFAWPGNVRQLLNTVQTATVMAAGEASTGAFTIDVRHIPQDIRIEDEGDEAEAGVTSAGSLAGASLEQLEKRAIRETLRLTAGNREQTAKLLGIGERTLYRKLKEYGLR